MGEWIECNLPWNKDFPKEYYDKINELNKPTYHERLEKKCLEKFGITYKQFLEEQHSYPTYWVHQQIWTVQNHNSYGKKIDEETALQLIINKFKDVDKTTIKCAERRLFEIQYHKWIQEQSEYNEWFSNREIQEDLFNYTFWL